MPILGLVIGISPDASLDEVTARLARTGGVRCGEAAGSRLPATLVRDDAAALDDALRALADERGVLVVDVVFHEFSDVHVAPRELAMPRDRSRRDATS